MNEFIYKYIYFNHTFFEFCYEYLLMFQLLCPFVLGTPLAKILRNEKFGAFWTFTEGGRWNVEGGRRKVEDERWKVESGRWKVEGGRQKVEGGI